MHLLKRLLCLLAVVLIGTFTVAPSVYASGGTYAWTEVFAQTSNTDPYHQPWTAVASSADGQKLIAVATGGVWTSNIYRYYTVSA